MRIIVDRLEIETEREKMTGICDFVEEIELDKLIQKVSTKDKNLRITPKLADSIIQARIEGDLFVLEEWSIKCSTQ